MLLRAADYPVMPWKNGGGQTREILVSPPSAGMQDFDWRISMATVEQDGPFSCFEGVERTLFVLDGAGMTLGFDDDRQVHLGLGDVLPYFAADTPVEARLTDGPITDLNIMTRRGKVTHQAHTVTFDGLAQFRAEKGTVALFFLERGVELTQNGETVALCAWDCVVLTPDIPETTLRGHGKLIQIDFAAAE